MLPIEGVFSGGHLSPTPVPCSASQELLSQAVRFTPAERPTATICPTFFGVADPTRGFFQKIQPETEMVEEWRAHIPLGRLSHEERFQRENGGSPRNPFQNQRNHTRLESCTKEKKFLPVHTYSEKEVPHAHKTSIHHRCRPRVGDSKTQDLLRTRQRLDQGTATAPEQALFHRPRP